MKQRFHFLTLIGAACVLGLPLLARAQVLKNEAAPQAEPGAVPRERLRRVNPVFEIVRQPEDRSVLFREEIRQLEHIFQKAGPAPAAPVAQFYRPEELVPRPAALVVRVVDLEALVPPLMTKFRSILRVEYHLLRTVCAPTKEERRQIARVGERALAHAAREYAAVQIKRRGPRKPGDYPFPDPRTLIQEGLAQAVRDLVSPERAARYQEEVAKRNTYRQQVVVHNVVAMLDQNLRLTDRQREQITQSLLSEWDDSWSQPLEALQNLDRSLPFPLVQVQSILPFLDGKQKWLWINELRFQNRPLWGFEEVVSLPDDPLEDEELTEARKDAEKPAGTQ